MNIIDFLQNDTAIEIIGYVASLLIAISMLMTSIVKLRWYVLIGNIVYVAYGILINSYPVITLNAFNGFVNIWFIWQAYTLHGNYEIINVENNSPMLDRFTTYYIEDIKKFFPYFTKFEDSDIIFMVVKGTAVIGVSAFRKNEDGSFDTVLDYAAKTHRNMKPAKLLYEQNDIFNRLNTTKIYANSFNKEHDKYLKKMNFVKTKTNKFCLSVYSTNKA